MTSVKATSIRPLARALAEPLAIWLVSGDGKILYVSAACGVWLGVEPDSLLSRGVAVNLSDPLLSPLDAIAVSLRPRFSASPGGLSPKTELAFNRLVHPPGTTAKETFFIPIPDGDGVVWLAIADVGLTSRVDASHNQAYASIVAMLERQLAVDPRQASSPNILGSSPWAERLRHQFESAATSNLHVTLHGPVGGGGESLARLIHVRSTGKNDLVKVAGALMDAELFDATTGGLIDNLLDDSKNKAAVLILDIDQMPADAQTRLGLLMHNYGARLRVFATSSLEPIRLSPTLVPELVSLGMLELYLPPLSFRVDDISQIAAALLLRRQVAGETRASQLGRETLDRLLLYPWPGNYEELDAAIRHAARQCQGETIRVEHLPLSIRSFGRAEKIPATADKSAKKIRPLVESLAETERSCIEAALEYTSGNRAAAARLLEISRPKLLRRIEQLAIDITDEETAEHDQRDTES
jgi:hypothetical protein